MSEIFRSSEQRRQLFFFVGKTYTGLRKFDPGSDMINKYIIKKCKTSTYQKSFLIRTSRIWNCLVDELDLSSSTLASFKSVIFNYYKSALAVSYDCEDPRSFKSICLKCNSARPLSRPITCCM